MSTCAGGACDLLCSGIWSNQLPRTRSWDGSLRSNSVLFLSLDEALAVHERVIAAFGGHSGVRDLGLLESALFRPQSGYYDDLVTMAAALFESLIMNHPFVDGNKRVAFFAADVFLRLNGWRLEVDAHEAHGLILQLLEDGHCDLQHLREWFQRALREL